jgi:Zn-dependent protease with chaperone function
VLADGLQNRADAMFLDHTSGDDADSDDDSERGPVKSVLRAVIFGPLLVLGVVLLPVVIVLTVIAGPPNQVIGVALSVIAVFMKYLSRFAVSILSRARESVADRTAATVIGSPMVLASALRTLDDRIAETPFEDLRELSSLSTLSILPLEPVEANVFVPSEVNGIKQSINTVLTRIARALFATHPPTDQRIDALTAISEDRQTKR